VVAAIPKRPLERGDVARDRVMETGAVRVWDAVFALGADGRAKLNAFSLPTGTRSPVAAGSSQLPVMAQTMPSGVFFAVCANAALDTVRPIPAATMTMDRMMFNPLPSPAFRTRPLQGSVAMQTHRTLWLTLQ
jgi:hypothetical protein